MSAAIRAGRAERLRLFVQSGMRAAFSWADLNCGFWACNWIRDERGIDPVADLRGAFADEAAVTARLAAEGGLAAWTDRIAAATGLAIATAPVAGDVAIVTTKLGPALMLITGAGADARFLCAWKSKHGVLFAADMTPDKAWTV